MTGEVQTPVPNLEDRPCQRRFRSPEAEMHSIVAGDSIQCPRHRCHLLPVCTYSVWNPENHWWCCRNTRRHQGYRAPQIFFRSRLSVSHLSVHSELTTASPIDWMNVLWILERIPPHRNPAQKTQVSLVFWRSIWFQRWQWLLPSSRLQHIFPLWFPSSTWHLHETGISVVHP